MLCQHCGNPYSGKVSRTLLAFPTFTCLACGFVNVYPLGNGYRGLYQILTVVFGISFIGGFSNGYLMLPGGVFIIAIVALMKNRKLKQRLSPLGRAAGTPAPRTAKVIIRAWHPGQLALAWLVLLFVAGIFYELIMTGGVPLTARRLMGLMVLAVIPATLASITWIWLGDRDDVTHSRVR